MSDQATPEMPASHLIETTDEDGNTHVFEKLEEYDIEGQRYALMIYVGEQEEGSTLEQAARQLAQQLTEDMGSNGNGNGNGHHTPEDAKAAVEPHVHGPNCNHGHDADGDDEGYDEELVIMRLVTDEDGDDIFEAIEDDAEFETVVSAIEAMSENGELPFELLDDEPVSNN